jgi:hypothetical protein
MMYGFQIGVDLDQCVGTPDGEEPTPHGTAIYAFSSTPSTFPLMTGPIIFEQSAANRDHPYADIEHRAGLPDIIHVAWWDITGPTPGIRYSAFTEGTTTPTVINLTTGGGRPPRVTASDSGTAIVYYAAGETAGSTYMCELNAARTGCTAPGWQMVPAALNWSTPGGGECIGPGVSGSDVCIRGEYPVSMAVSETGTRLYYCFHKLETNGPGPDGDTREETDAYCTSATKDVSTGIWTFNTTPVPVAGVTNDDHDQFFPEVAVTSESSTHSTTGDTAIVTWYDRTDDPSNYLFKTKKTLSTDGMATVLPMRDVTPLTFTDPNSLPRHCFNPDIRFIGDYSAAEGDTLHVRTLSIVGNSSGTTIQTLPYADFNSLGRWDR